jgi:hypothetical protein
LSRSRVVRVGDLGRESKRGGVSTGYVLEEIARRRDVGERRKRETELEQPSAR